MISLFEFCKPPDASKVYPDIILRTEWILLKMIVPDKTDGIC